MLLFIPGRHHLATQFQHDFLKSVVEGGIQAAERLICDHDELPVQGPVDGVIFGVTSSNHFGTKRNPLPFYLRALILHELGKTLPVPVYVYGVNDVGHIQNFASFTLKTIDHQSGYRFDLAPTNTVVVCSTPVLEGYRDLGYRILPAEWGSNSPFEYAYPLPWTWVEKIAENPAGLRSPEISEGLHESSLGVWSDYRVGEMVQEILNDPIIGEDGDLTESRDYGTYIRQMDQNAELKYQETAAFIRPGRIGDIGCAVGSWLKLACAESRLHESDFYGIEIARQLFDVCTQRKLNGEFENPSIFFSKANAITGLCFHKNSMDTIHTGSITHEIESYGSRDELLQFIDNRYRELKPEGVWINRDVVGPENGDRTVRMWLDPADGNEFEICPADLPPAEKADWLRGLSTFARFFQFAKDFRTGIDASIDFKLVETSGRKMIETSYRNAAEYLLTKDYVDNWASEMRERFCFWAFSDWVSALGEAGFAVVNGSHAYLNPWIYEKRMLGKVELFELDGQTPVGMPPSNVLLVAQKQ